MTETRIQFGKSFDPIIDEMSKKASSMNLEEIAKESRPGKTFDIKVKFKNVAGLLKGKYASVRSAGNYLAGYNAAKGKMYGFAGVTFTGFQKLAGALHVKGNLTRDDMMDIILNGKSYGAPPTYGENYYQYRMSYAGWYDAKSE